MQIKHFIIFFGEKIGLKKSYRKRQGQGSGATGLAQWKNGSRRWANVERGDDTGKQK
jgi:hypothetical protein